MRRLYDLIKRMHPLDQWGLPTDFRQERLFGQSNAVDCGVCALLVVEAVVRDLEGQAVIDVKPKCARLARRLEAENH